MKTIFLVIGFGAMAISNVFAQKNTKGQIEYKEVMQLDINLDDLGDIPEAAKAMIPTEHVDNYTLYFDGAASYCTTTKTEETNDVDYKSEDEDIQIDIRMGSQERLYYKDLKTKETLEEKDLFGRKFLVKGKAEMKKWKIGSETKEILGYTCQKASLTDEEGEVTVVWFTNEIPTAVGPMGMNELPGAVLAVNGEEGRYVVEATKVTLGKVVEGVIVKPKKGKKLSQEEFEKVLEEKRKEMNEAYGGKGVIIKTEIREE